MWYDFFRRTECSQKGFAYYMETFEHTGLQDKDCRIRIAGDIDIAELSLEMDFGK